MGCLRSTVTALLLCISLVSMVDFFILAHRGDAKATLTELLQPSNTEESSARATKPDWKKEEDEANEVHSYSNTRNKNTEELKLFEASDEIFKMLNRDYDLRPRHHPPVHN